MPVGVEFYTPDGYRQLTDTLRYWSLEYKSVLDETNWVSNTQWGGSGGLVLAKTVFVSGPSLTDFPVVAISCSTGTFAEITAASGGINVTVFRLNRTSPGTVTLYVFSRRRPPDPGFGMAIYDASGIVFSALTPIVRPLGLFNNNGYSGVSMAGRQCAHIPQRRARGTTRTFTVGGLGSCTTTGPSGTPTQGYQTSYRDREDVWFVSCSGESVSVDAISYAPTSQTPLTCSIGSTSTPPPTYARQTAYRSLVVDVTNY